MRILNHKETIFLIPILIWIFSQIFVAYPSFFFISLTLSFLLLALTVKSIFNNYPLGHWSFYLYFPGLLMLTSFLYATMLANKNLVQAVLLLAIFLLGIYLYNFYYFFRYQAPERQQFLDSFSFATVVLSVFFMASSTYGLATFLGWSFAWLLLAFLLFSLPLFFQPFITQRLNIRLNWPWFLSSVFILTQLVAVFYFLPLSFSIVGLLVAIFFYLLLLIIRLLLKDNLSGKILRFPLISSFLITLILLLSSRWL